MIKLNDKYYIVCRDMYLNSPYSEQLFEDWTEEEIQSLLDYDPEIMELRKEIEAIHNGPKYSNFVWIATKNTPQKRCFL